MFHTDTVATAAPASAVDAPTVLHPPLTLDALLQHDVAALRALYLGARVPQLEDVRGDLRGRLLANVLFGGAGAAALVRLASSDHFPWRGKSFAPYDLNAGEGINRVVSERLRIFPFTTFIGRSRAGDFDALQLDYDRPDNPWFIRPIKDEIRQLRPGLYLGQAYLSFPQERLVLYFGLTSDGVVTTHGRVS